MELCCIEIVLVHRSAEGMDVFGHRRSMLADRHIVAMDEIDKGIGWKSLK